jgi:ATP-dependent helicase/nuclease subunit A
MSLDVAPGLTDAVERLRILLDAPAADSPLMAGRTDAVRVMNLHLAKGLEADVVILAAPADESDHALDLHVARGPAGATTGGLRLRSSDDEHKVLAQPVGWEEMESAEQHFAAAEAVRLLYVATTRARRQLVVAQSRRVVKGSGGYDKSIWRALAPTIESHAPQLSITPLPARGREKLQRGAGDLSSASAAAAARVRAASQPRLLATTVTRSAKEEHELAREYDLPIRGDGAPRGVAWGRAVHRAMEALGKGRRGAALRVFISAVAGEEGLAGHEEILWETVRKAAESEAWRDLTAGGAPLCELPVMRANVAEDGTVTLVQGVIDAAVLGDDGWTVVDWKTDAVSDEVWRARLETYQRQVDEYARILSELTGVPAAGRLEHIRSGADR